MKAPRQVEMILKHGSKSSTYKYALLKALIDYVIESPTEEAWNGFHYVPGIYLAKKFLRYYWPLHWHDIPQSNSNRTAIEGYFENFRSAFHGDLHENYSLDSDASVMSIIEGIDTREDLPKPYIQLLQATRRTVINMPVKHVRNVRGEEAHLFSVYHKQYSIIDTDFETLIQKGSNQIQRNDQTKNYLELKENEPFYILIADRVYEELSELRFWIDSIITKKWYEECLGYREDRMSFPHNAFFNSLSRDLGKRDSLVQYRKFYRELGVPDFYTGNELRSFDVDHFLPWSRLPVNRFWNLVPTRKSINSRKSDRLIVLTDEIRNKRLPEHIDRCLSTDRELIRHDLQATYQKYFNGNIPSNKSKRREDLRQLVLGLYDNLDTISVEDKVELEELLKA